MAEVSPQSHSLASLLSLAQSVIEIDIIRYDE